MPKMDAEEILRCTNILEGEKNPMNFYGKHTEKGR